MEQGNYYFVPLLISAVIAIVLGVYAWQRRAMVGAVPISYLAFLVALWCVGYAMETLAPSLAGKLFWAKIEYIASVLTPVLLLVFALQYTGLDAWLTRTNILLLLIVPVVTLLLVWTNERHLLIWSTYTVDGSGVNPGLVVEHGFFYWVFTAFSYTCVLIGALLLAQAIYRSQDLYRKQALVFLLGSLAPWVGNVLYISGADVFNRIELAPFALTITVALYSIGEFRFQFLDLLPVARDALIENMIDAVLVLDASNRVVDLNPAARALIGGPNSTLIGRPVEHVLQGWPELIAIYQDADQAHTEILHGQTAFDLRITPIYDRRAGRISARLVVLRNISERWYAQQAVQKAKDELELRVEERTVELQSANQRLQAEISERIQMQAALAYRMRLEEMIASISTRFIDLEPHATDGEIMHTLQVISDLFQVDRSAVFLLSDDARYINCAYDWSLPGRSAPDVLVATMPVERFPWGLARLGSLEPFQINNIMELPDEAAAEKQLFSALGFLAVIVVPMTRRGRLVGFLGFSSMRAVGVREWSNEDIALLKMIAEIFTNALERRRAVKQLEASAHEKELLLKEIHHRVKNNLQIISSLLNLQAGAVSDPQILNVLRESQTRVRTMGLIHEKLYQSNNLADIAFDGYLQNLAAYLFSAYDGHRKGLRLALDIDEIYLDMDTAIPCGLIVNELVSNALKYAYPAGTQGEIRIELKRSAASDLKLVVADHGRTFPADLDFRKTQSLGLQLVCSLAEQLNGAIALDRSAGTRFEIAFSAG